MEEKESKKKSRVRIFSIKAIKAKRYDTIDLGEYYNNLLGNIESRTAIFAYGTSGSGKSVFILKLSDHFSIKHGKAIYNSHEEATKKSIQDRINNFEISSVKLFIGEQISFDDMMRKIKSNYYRLAVIDSVQYMQFTYAQLIELNETFKKRKIVLIIVSSGQAYKKPDCSKDIMHACDVKMFFDKGEAIVDSRYKNQTVKTRIFTPDKAGIVQKTLFDN